MTDTKRHLVAGVDHIAYPTFDPAATVELYHDVLGFPIAHAISAKGWGPNNHPDFVHFFFDIGHGDRLAFFYYFGLERYEDTTPWLLRHSSRHLAIHVDTEADLDEYEARLNASSWPVHMRVTHETIESIYVIDPNDYLMEFTVGLRPLEQADLADAQLSVQAMVDVFRKFERPTLADMWNRKAELLETQNAAPTSEPTPGEAR
jgi:catechol 2,3-dioxygenase-like lactoylglutathione lyase family enzyme